MRAVGASLPGLAAVLSTGAAACGGPPPPSLRPEPIPYADTLPVAPPAFRQPNQTAALVKEAVGGEIGRTFSLRRWLGAEHEAVNVTAFDDVVSSAWFEHRNGRTPMTPAEVARGPNVSGPDPGGPLTVVAGKDEGISPGFTVRDARGVTFFLKFDPKGALHLASAAGVIAGRLLYAAGWHVPEDYILEFERERLVLDPDAEVSGEGEARPMEGADIDRILALTDTLPGGRYLAIASKALPGSPLGPFRFEGRRGDDPNDWYHHEYRRELRGLYVVSAWLNHVDVRYENTLDVYVDPPGYVKHHLIDFAASLGSGTIRSHYPREGAEYNFDFWPTIGRLLSLGFYTRGWEDRPYRIDHPSIGWIPVEEFDPGSWKPNWPNQAFAAVTPRDGYWGAKLVGSFTDAQLRAAVEEGALPTATAADTLVAILAHRRDRTVAHWYGRVSPIEDVSVGGPRERRAAAGGEVLTVSFEDLGLRAGAWRPGETRYRFELEDPSRDARATGTVAASPGGGRQSLDIRLPTGGERRGDGETALATLRIAALRDGGAGRPATVYLDPSPDDGWRVVGLEH